MSADEVTLLGLVLSLFELGGIAAAVHAVMTARTSQGAIAWIFPLVVLPVIAVPLYLVFGRSKFNGYVRARRGHNCEILHILDNLRACGPQFTAQLEEEYEEHRVLEQLAWLPFTRGNRLELLVDGTATFDSILAGIDAAREYILVQFFIVHDDEIGREVKSRLTARAREGVKVYFLYDEIGSHSLPGRYLREMREAGIEVRPFHSTRGWANRFQLNFRNHRKIVVADGRTAWVGGHNIGDEYLGRSSEFGPWRDTHLRIEGPAVTCVQLSFLEDWYWASHEVPGLHWLPRESDETDCTALVLATGPADELETCTLFFLHAISTARHRLWIASPYFVPDSQILSALQLAALRGVDVRILLPDRADHILVYLSAFSFIEQLAGSGVRFYRYQPGFLHQKVLLVDDDLAAVGTANLDNRSLRLNFEITIAALDRGFAAQIREMLERDCASSHPADADELHQRSLAFRFLVRCARLTAPVQ